MAVNQVGNNPEHDQIADEKSFADNLLNQISLPESIKAAVDEAEKNEKAAEEVKEPEETQEQEEPQKEESPDELEKETEEAESESSEEEEELIPRSKVQKRLDEMTREKKLLEMRLKKLEDGQVTGPQRKDEDTERLEKMSENELLNLKRQVRLSQIQNQADPTMVNKLFDLEDKIETVMRTAPHRFSENQNNNLVSAIEMSRAEIPEFDKVQKEVFALADTVYRTAPELQGSIHGKARAWDLAVQHYKTLQSVKADKVKLNEMDRQVNTLKRKVSVGGGSKKSGAQETDDTAKLFKRAKNGELGDKLEFIRKRMGTDATIDRFMSGKQ